MLDSMYGRPDDLQNIADSMPKPPGNVDDDSETNQGQESDASTGGRAPTADLAPTIARPTPPGRPGMFTAPSAVTPAPRVRGGPAARAFEAREGRVSEAELRDFAQATGRSLGEARAYAIEKGWTIK